MNGGACEYHAPALLLLDVCSEGMLCSSFDTDNYTEVFDRLDMEDI